MPHCHCEELERRFDLQRVKRELTDYHRHGAASATRLLIETLQAESLEGMTLLDIGGGIGAIQHALVPAGVSSALDVDASPAYLAAAREEAEQRGLAERIHFVHGNFVEVASAIPPADLVTLDRVICCFHDMPALVSLSAARAQQLYGVVIPHDTWYRRLFNQIHHLMLVIARLPIHFYVYRADAIDAVVRAQGLERRFSSVVDKWQVVIYARSSLFTCTGYLDHPFKNKPYKTGKDLLPNLQTEADWCTIRRRHRHPHARTMILSGEGEASFIWLVF